MPYGMHWLFLALFKLRESQMFRATKQVKFRAAEGRRRTRPRHEIASASFALGRPAQIRLGFTSVQTLEISAGTWARWSPGRDGGSV